jgi:hypothetical protein
MIQAFEGACAAVICKLLGKAPVCLIRFGDNHEPRCIFVKAVDNAWALYASDAR